MKEHRDGKKKGKSKGRSKVVASMLLMTAGVFLLMACGGGGGDATPAGRATVSLGTLTKGSVIVNGTRFTAAAGATIKIDDNPGRPETELRDGMQVKVKGTINDDRLNGQFEKVEAEPEVRGRLANKGVDDFLVNGQRVVVDDATTLEDRSVAGAFSTISINDLADLNEVEVHGGRDDAGIIHATRVERRAEDTLDEVKGMVVAPVTATTFILTNGTSSITVDFTGATFSPAGKTAADLIAGAAVEVHGGLNAFDTATKTFTAGKIDFEDAEDAEFEPQEGQDAEVEGLIAGFTAHPGAFTINGVTVETNSATKFVAGVAADLANNIKVEAEGHRAGNVLVADKIKFKDSVRIEANVTDVAVGGSSLTVLGQPVKITSNTLPVNNGPVGIGGGVKIRGFAVGSSITAIRIDVTSPVSNDILQGPVTAATPTTGLTIAGITVSTSGAGVIFKDANEAIISAAAFFGKVKTTPPATVVKAKGSFAAGVLTASEVELED